MFATKTLPSVKLEVDPDCQAYSKIGPDVQERLLPSERFPAESFRYACTPKQDPGLAPPNRDRGLLPLTGTWACAP